MLSGFESYESISKIKNFDYLNFLKKWKDYFSPDILSLLESSDISHAFLPNKGDGFFSKHIEEKFQLIRINEDGVNVYIRSNNTINPSNSIYYE